MATRTPPVFWRLCMTRGWATSGVRVWLLQAQALGRQQFPGLYLLLPASLGSAGAAARVQSSLTPQSPLKPAQCCLFASTAGTLLQKFSPGSFPTGSTETISTCSTARAFSHYIQHLFTTGASRAHEEPNRDSWKCHAPWMVQGFRRQNVYYSPPNNE